MKKQLLSNFLVGASACALSFLGAKQACAQAAPSGTSFYGNATGTNAMTVLSLAPTTTNKTPYIHMFGNDFNNADVAGSVNYISGYNQNGNAAAHSFQLRDASGNSWNRALQIFQNGQVLIGTGIKPTTQPGYKLAVGGKLVAQSLYITAPSKWADFVFEPSYKPMTIPALEIYLHQNKHLPYIPSAQDVESDGYNVSEMDAKLLRTMEEMTLQVIKLDKEVKKLKTENIQMRKHIMHLTKK